MAVQKPQFATPSQRQDHFQRHGPALHAISPVRYESAAAKFLMQAISSHILQKSRSNGDIVRYNQLTQEFAIMSAKGTIRTYFIPNPAVHGYSTNLDYFHAQ